MKNRAEYLLPIAGLPLGATHYTFDLGLTFFMMFGSDEVEDAGIRVSLNILKHASMIELDFTFSGWFEVMCDRCGDDYRQPVEGNERLILKYGDHYEEESEEIILIPAELHEFDVSTFIFEFAVLLLPVRRIHPDRDDGSPGCNTQALNLLGQMSAPTTTDPRWDALKDLDINI